MGRNDIALNAIANINRSARFAPSLIQRALQEPIAFRKPLHTGGYKQIDIRREPEPGNRGFPRIVRLEKSGGHARN